MDHRPSPRLWLYVWLVLCLTGPTTYGAARAPYMQPTFMVTQSIDPNGEKPAHQDLNRLRMWGEWFAGLAVMCLFVLALVGLTGSIIWLPFVLGIGMIVSGIMALFLGAFALAQQPGDDQSLMVLSVGLFLAVLGSVLLPFLRQD